MKAVPLRYALFSGCAVGHLGSPARRATIALARMTGIELWEPPPRGCCGARVDRPAGEAVLRGIETPLTDGMSQGLAIACLSPGCRQVLTAHQVPTSRGRPEADPDPAPAPQVLDLVQILTREDDPNRLANALVRSLSPLRVALHNTCHGDHIPSPDSAPHRPTLVDVPGVPQEADGAAERTATTPSPQALAGLIAVTGAEPLEDVGIEGRCAETPLLPAPTGGNAEAPPCLRVAARAGIDLLVTPCFLCFGTLNDRQRRLGRRDPARSVPVLHLAQLLGMACGAAPMDLKLHYLTAPARRVLAPFAG
jgi:succinate dehydrogenase / fumarate reductase cytochrome b subunit